MERSGRLLSRIVCLAFVWLIDGVSSSDLAAQGLNRPGDHDEQFGRALRVFQLPYRDLCRKRFVQAELGVIEDQSDRLVELMDEYSKSFEKLTVQLARSQFEATSEEQQAGQAEFERQLRELNEQSVASLNEILLPHQQTRLTEISLQRVLQLGRSSHVFEMFAALVPETTRGIEGVEQREIRSLHETSEREREKYVIQEQELVQQLMDSGLARLDEELRERVKSEIGDLILVDSILVAVSDFQMSVLSQWMQQNQALLNASDLGKRPRIKNAIKSDETLESLAFAREGGRLFEDGVAQEHLVRAHAVRGLNHAISLRFWEDTEEIEALMAESFELGCQQNVLVALAIGVPALQSKIADFDQQQRETMRPRVEALLIDDYQRSLNPDNAARHQQVNQLRAMGHEGEANDLRGSLLREYVQWQEERIGSILDRELLPHQAEKVRKYARQLRVQRSQERTDPFATMIRLIEASDWEERDREQVVEILTGCRAEFLDRAIEMHRRATERIEGSLSRELREYIESRMGEPYDYYEELRAEME